MSASSDNRARESIHIEVLPKRSTDQPVIGITLAAATPLRQPRVASRRRLSSSKLSSTPCLIGRTASGLSKAAAPFEERVQQTAPPMADALAPAAVSATVPVWIAWIFIVHLSPGIGVLPAGGPRRRDAAQDQLDDAVGERLPGSLPCLWSATACHDLPRHCAGGDERRMSPGRRTWSMCGCRPETLERVRRGGRGYGLAAPAAWRRKQADGCDRSCRS
jgi:hypothetical protein